MGVGLRRGPTPTVMLRSRVHLILVYALAPLIVGALWILYLATDDTRFGGSVQILDGGVVVETSTRVEALEYVAAKTGMKPVLPAVLPYGGYELTSVNAVQAQLPMTGYIGARFTYDRGDGDPAWFWVNQFPANFQFVPEGIPEVETAVEGAQIWTLGEPPKEYVEATGQGFQFIARTAKYDRIISFEGAYRPDMVQARLVIESMLRQD